MEITEVRVKLVDGKKDKLKAFCSITIDDAFVIRDLKIIEGSKGLFVAMPSRKLTSRCASCGSKNQVGSRFCSACGASLDNHRSLGASKSGRRGDGRIKLHADIAHPINSDCREDIQSRVLESFHEEVTASQQPGYQPLTDFDDDEDHFGSDLEESFAPSGVPAAKISGSRTSSLPSSVAPVKQSGHAADPVFDSNSPPPEDNFGAGIF